MSIRTVQMLHFDNVTCYVGQTLVQGSVIGIEGNTGYSFGDHVHISVIPIFRTTNWNGDQNVPQGGTKAMIIDEFLGGLTHNFLKYNNAYIPYYVTTGWWGIDANSYENHYAIDIDHGGPDEYKPFVCWPLPYPGKVESVDNIDDGAWGKCVVISYDYGGSAISYEGGAEEEKFKFWLYTGKANHY